MLCYCVVIAYTCMCFVEGGVGKKHRTNKKKTTKQTNNEPNIICEGMFLLKFVTAPPPPYTRLLPNVILFITTAQVDGRYI